MGTGTIKYFTMSELQAVNCEQVLWLQGGYGGEGRGGGREQPHLPREGGGHGHLAGRTEDHQYQVPFHVWYSRYSF